MHLVVAHPDLFVDSRMNTVTTGLLQATRDRRRALLAFFDLLSLLKLPHEYIAYASVALHDILDTEFYKAECARLSRAKDGWRFFSIERNDMSTTYKRKERVS